MSTQKYQQKVDQLVQHFWKYGYLTLSRKFGTYLPEPKPVGVYNVDAVGKQRKKYAIGIILSEDELNDSAIYDKLGFLASRQNRHTNVKVTLFIGVPQDYIEKTKLIISTLDQEIRRNIKVVGLPSQRFN
jgi:hypothetical protein